MAHTKQIDGVLLAEIAGTRMILRALIEGTLPVDPAQARGELDAMVRHIEEKSRSTVIEGLDREKTNATVAKAAANSAIRFVRTIVVPDIQKH